jgi:hypothetical protein
LWFPSARPSRPRSCRHRHRDGRIRKRQTIRLAFGARKCAKPIRDANCFAIAGRSFCARTPHVGDDKWVARMEAPQSGRWSLDLGINLSATDAVNIEAPILIR